MRKFLLTSGALLALAVPAHAAVVQESAFITSDHCTDLCGNGSASGQPGGFGKITATDFGNGTIDISIQLFNGNTFTNGGQTTFGFNLIGNPLITYSNLDTTAPNPVWGVAGVPAGTLTQSAGSLGGNGFGNFEYGVNLVSPNGASTFNTLSFTIKGSGLDIGDFAEFGTGTGANAAYMVFDIASGTNFGSDGKPRTGHVDVHDVLSINPVLTGVPEPSTWAMMLIGFLGVGLFGMRGKAGASSFRMFST
jgi:hypothetical protein